MTFEEFNKFFEEFVDDCRKMRDTKGKEYAGDGDRFDNFNRGAAKKGISRLQVAGIYLDKHLDAIDSYIRNRSTFSNESIRGRYIDAITYLILMAGMTEEESSYGWQYNKTMKSISKDTCKSCGTLIIQGNCLCGNRNPQPA